MIFQTSSNIDKEFNLLLKKLKFLALQNGLIPDIKENDKKEKLKKTDIKIFLFPEGRYPAPFWKFDFNQKKHIVALPIREDIDKRFLTDTIHSFFHEMSHARFTNKNIEEINKKMNKAKVPFDYVNIFEDIRIERKIIDYLKKPIYKYSEDFYKVKVLEREEIKYDDDVFTVLIKLLKFSGYYTSSAFDNPYFIQILNYVENAINAKNTDEVADISIDFFNTFKDYLPQQNEKIKQKAKILGTEVDNFKISNDFLENFLGDDLIQEIESVENKEIKFDTESKHIGQLEEELSNSKFIEIKSVPKKYNPSKEFIQDLEQVKKYIDSIKIQKAKLIAKNKFEGDKLNIKEAVKFATGIDYNAKIIYEKKIIKDDFPKINFFIDISGSMQGYPIETAQLILLAYNELISRKKTDTYFTLIKNNKYQTFKMPVHPSIIMEIQKVSTGGTEGFKKAFNNLFYLINKADYNIVISDLLVSDKDEPILKNFFKKNKNAYLLYADENYNKNIEKNINSISQGKYFYNENRIKLVKDFTEAVQTGRMPQKNFLLNLSSKPAVKR